MKGNGMNKGLEVGKYIVFVDSWLDLICRILVGVEKQQGPVLSLECHPCLQTSDAALHVVVFVAFNCKSQKCPF